MFLVDMQDGRKEEMKEESQCRKERKKEVSN